MGYSTYFNGGLKFNKPVTKELRDYINKFSSTRRMKRDVEAIKRQFPNWKELCFNGELGVEGEYFIGGDGFMGQGVESTIVNYNRPPAMQPGLWCQWIIQYDELVWDEGEKFYCYVEWLKYLIKHFFEPQGYVLNGEISYEGEDSEDFGVIVVTDNDVEVKYGIHVYSLNEISDSDLLDEMKRRGYNVG